MIMNSAPRWIWIWELALVAFLLAPCIRSAATALSLTPSTSWYGFDGTWSAISLRVGTPQQWVDVMVNTVSSETWLVSPGGCAGNNSLCTSARGYTFNPDQSTTWQDQGFFNLGVDCRLGGNAYANYGLDDITFGSTCVTLPQTIIGSINTTEFLLGFFGLGVVPGNFKNITSIPAINGLVEENGVITSHSYGYTAGAKYQQKGTPNSLTLGGYDANRLQSNNITFNLNPSQNPQVAINYISVVSSAAANNWTSPIQLASAADRISAVIDSSTPYLWLPQSVCDSFAQALGLSYNNSLDLYTFDGNSSQHDVLTNSQLSFTFSLSDTSTSTEIINITLPYAAFDLQLTYPFPALNSSYGAADSSKYYFPLKRTTNEAQYTIGRAFLQEAYLITDYERNTFSVHQAIHTANPLGNTSIQAITSPSDSTFTSSNTPTTRKMPSSKLSSGVIVGIAVGAAVIFAFLSFVLFLFRRRKQNKTGPEEKSGIAQPHPFFDLFRRRQLEPPVIEAVGSTSYPTEVSADAEHERFELPAPLGAAELDSEIGTLDGTTEQCSSSMTDSNNISAYDQTRRKLEDQQAANENATEATSSAEKSVHDLSLGEHYPLHESADGQTPLVSPMVESPDPLATSEQPSPTSSTFTPAPTSPTSPPPTYRQLSPGNFIYAGRLPANTPLPHVTPQLINSDGRTRAETLISEPGSEGEASTLGSQYTEHENAEDLDVHLPPSPVSSAGPVDTGTEPRTSAATASSSHLRAGGQGGREEDESKFLAADVEMLRRDMLIREQLDPYKPRNRLLGEDLVHVPVPAHHRFSFEEDT